MRHLKEKNLVKYQWYQTMTRVPWLDTWNVSSTEILPRYLWATTWILIVQEVYITIYTLWRVAFWSDDMSIFGHGGPNIEVNSKDTQCELNNRFKSGSVGVLHVWGIFSHNNKSGIRGRSSHLRWGNAGICQLWIYQIVQLNATRCVVLTCIIKVPQCVGGETPSH